MKGRTQVCCQCEEDQCFLEKDAEWSALNSALGPSQNTPFGVHLLDAERLRCKEAWMDHLQVQGTLQVRCRRLAEKKP